MNPHGGFLSLGALPGSTGDFGVPDDVNLGAYSFLDVSDEPLDGNPAHSTVSVARGELLNPG
jgi:hypothetical protein